MKTIIFGLDGVLVDSTPLYLQTLLTILNEHNARYDKNETELELVARDRFEQVRFLKERFGIEEKAASINARCKDTYCKSVAEKDTASETLSELKNDGYSLYVLSATPHETADACLRRLGLFDLFDHIWTYEDFHTEKTDAGLFRTIAEKLGTTADQCFFVDSCISVLQAAKNAGMKVIGVFDDCCAQWNGKIKEFADGYAYRLKEISEVIGGRKYATVNDYIEFNWDSVIRECREDGEQHLGLPYPFTVPAVGKFETLYYWDTYFTNVGLMLDGREALAKNNVDNMLYLVDKLGFMPNSTGTYHLDHSQPPFLSIMVRETYACYQDKKWLASAYKTLCREYEFWMTQRSTPHRIEPV